MGRIAGFIIFLVFFVIFALAKFVFTGAKAAYHAVFNPNNLDENAKLFLGRVWVKTDFELKTAYEMKFSSSDNHLGGDVFDQRIINFLANEFKKDEGVDLRKDAMALQRLKVAAEKAKNELRSSHKTNVKLPFITATDSGPKHLNINLTRSMFEQMEDGMLIQKIVLDLIPQVQNLGREFGYEIDRSLSKNIILRAIEDNSIYVSGQELDRANRAIF